MPLKKYLKKNIKKIITIMIMIILIPNLVEAKDKPGFLERNISEFLTSISGAANDAITGGSNSKYSIDRLIYNGDGSTEQETTLILFDKSIGLDSTIRSFIIEFYLIFQYIAACIFVPLGLWLTIYFVRAKYDAQKKAILKDKLIKWLLTFVLIASMPYFLEMINIVNNVLVSVFRYIGINFISKSGANLSGGYLADNFKTLAADNKDFISTSIYLASVGFNIWLMFFYFIRDLTVGYLFIIFPIICILYTFDREMFANWFKNMVSNISGQLIQAAVFTVNIALYSYVMGNGKSPSTPEALFVLTSYAMIIPMTSKLKRLLKLEGDIGAAASMAGLGGAIMAFQLGRGIVRGAKNSFSNMASGAADIFNGSKDKLALEKNLQGDTSSLQDKELSNPKPKSLEEINKSQREGVRKMLKGAGGLTGGTIGAFAGASTMLTMGKQGIALGGAAGALLGGKVGAVTGTAAGMAENAIGFGMDVNKAINDENFSKEMGLEQITENTNTALQGTDFLNQENKAVLAKKLFENMGANSVASSIYTSMAPKRASMDEISKCKNLKQVTDKNKSVIYGTDLEGNKKILSVGDGNKSLGRDEYTVSNFSIGDGTSSDDSLIKSQADGMLNTMENENMLEKNPVYRNGYLKEEQRLNNINAANIANNESPKYSMDQISIMSSQKGKEAVRASIESSLMGTRDSINKATGLNTVPLGITQKFDDKNLATAKFNDIENIGSTNTEELNLVGNLSSTENISNSNGYMYVGKDGLASVFTVSGDGSYENPATSSFAGTLQVPREISGSMGTTTNKFAPVKIEDGQVFSGNLYEASGYGNYFKEQSPIKAETFENPIERLGAQTYTSMDPNEQYIVTVSKGESNNGQYVIASSQGNLMDVVNIPQGFSEKLNNGEVYHLTKNINGEVLQHYSGNMSDMDMHINNMAISRENIGITSNPNTNYEPVKNFLSNLNTSSSPVNTYMGSSNSRLSEIPTQVNLQDTSSGYMYVDPNGQATVFSSENNSNRYIGNMNIPKEFSSVSQIGAAPIKIENGKLYSGKVQDISNYGHIENEYGYAADIPNNQFSTIYNSQPQVQTFERPIERLGAYAYNSIQPNQDYIVTVSKGENNSGQYLIASSQGELVNMVDIPYGYSEDLSTGQVYHISKNEDGNVVQSYSGNIRDVDLHINNVAIRQTEAVRNNMSKQIKLQEISNQKHALEKVVNGYKNKTYEVDKRQLMLDSFNTSLM